MRAAHPRGEVLEETHHTVVVGHAEEVGDHHDGVRHRIVVRELALPGVDELVDGLIGERPEERLVLLEPLRRDGRMSTAVRVCSAGRTRGAGR
jgi:hypothetical protein